MKRDYHELSERRRRELRAQVVLRRLLRESPLCRGCDLDLLALAERRLRAVEAIDSAAFWCISVLQRPCPVEWRLLRPQHPVLAALRAMGFDKPASALAEHDHIVPIWAGGEDTMENSQVLCQPCHRAKSKREAAELARARHRARSGRRVRRADR